MIGFKKIDIISSENDKAILEFIDDSKIGSYYAHSELEVRLYRFIHICCITYCFR